jgi:hypothetical protein
MKHKQINHLDKEYTKGRLICGWEPGTTCLISLQIIIAEILRSRVFLQEQKVVMKVRIRKLQNTKMGWTEKLS